MCSTNIDLLEMTAKKEVLYLQQAITFTILITRSRGLSLFLLLVAGVISKEDGWNWLIYYMVNVDG